jgi:hypothetical protein
MRDREKRLYCVSCKTYVIHAHDFDSKKHKLVTNDNRENINNKNISQTHKEKEVQSSEKSIPTHKEISVSHTHTLSLFALPLTQRTTHIVEEKQLS